MNRLYCVGRTWFIIPGTCGPATSAGLRCAAAGCSKIAVRAVVRRVNDGQSGRRLGVITPWKHGPHQLTYRQTERTFGLVTDALAKNEPDGLPAPVLQGTCDDLTEASVPARFKDASAALAVDWTDLESFSRPPPHGTRDCADPEASWGHRKNNLLRSENELYYRWYLSAGTMAPYL